MIESAHYQFDKMVRSMLTMGVQLPDGVCFGVTMEFAQTVYNEMIDYGLNTNSMRNFSKGDEFLFFGFKCVVV